MKPLLVILSILFLKGCLVQNSNSKVYMKTNYKEIEKTLIEIGYGKIFNSENSKQLNSLWANGENLEKFEDIFESEDSTLLGKFLAAETLRYYEIKLDEKYIDKLSESYVYALEKTNMEEDDFIGIYANSWGFLYNHTDTGHLGKQLISFGESGVHHLVKLLEIKGIVFYQGSQDATIGNSYQYRIKDFAAFNISKIKNIPITFYQDFDKRDAEIERLKEILANE